MIDPQNTAITIHGELVDLINSGEAVNLGLLVYDVQDDALKFISFCSESGAMLAKFGIATQVIK